MTRLSSPPDSPRLASIRSNPFATRFVRPGAIEFRFESDAAQDPCSILDVIAKLRQHRFGLIVGPHGSGKSTMLYSMMPQLHEQFDRVERLQLHSPDRCGRWHRWLHWRRAAQEVLRSQTDLGSGGLLVIDGIEQLSTLDRFQTVRRANQNHQTLLATSHRVLSPLHVVYRTTVSRPLVNSLAASLLKEFDNDVRCIVEQELQNRQFDSLTDVRQLWFDLYDLFHIHQQPTLPPGHAAFPPPNSTG